MTTQRSSEYLLKNAGLLGLILACAMTWPAAGANRNWTGNAFNNNWSEPDNWSPSGPPQDGDALAFGNSGVKRSNNNNLSGLQVQSIVFSGSSGGYTLNGNPIRLNLDITAAHASGFNRVRCGVEFVDGGGTFSVVGAGQLEISGNVTLANNRLLGLYALGANLTLSGAIEGDGELIKLGEQALFLSGNAANTYTGPTTIKVGAMYLAKPSAARAISSQVVIGPDPQFPCSLADLEGGQYPPAMSMYVGPSATWSLTNGATVSSLTLDNGTIRGEGLLNLQCNVTNLGFSDVQCSIFLGNATRTFSVEYDDSFLSQLDIRGHILGPSSGANSPGLIKTGPGLLLLKNQNTYSGRTLIERGTLYAMHPEALGTTAGETRVGPLGELALWSSVANIPLTCAEPLVMEGGRLYSLSDAIATGPLTLADYCEIDGPDAGRFVLNTTLTGPGGFTVRSGTVRLSGAAANTFAGDVLVEAGFFSPPVLELNKSVNSVAIPTSVTLQGFGTNNATLRSIQDNGARDITLFDGGVWHLNGFAALPDLLTFRGAGTVDTGYNGATGILNFTGSGVNTQLQVLPKLTAPSNYTARILGRVDFFSSTNDVSIPSGVTLDWPAEIRGIALQKRGPGKLVLGGDNRFLGQIFARDGELVSTDDHALGVHTTVADGATLWLASTFNFGSLTLAGRGFQNQGALATDTLAIFSSNIILSASAAIQTPTTNSMLFINGPISGAGPLSKDGVGLLVLGGSTPNTFTGDMLVNAGRLELGKNDFVPAVPGDIVIGTGEAPGAHVLYSGHDQVWNRITVNRFSVLDLNGRDEYSGDLTIGGGTVETRNGTLHLGAGVNLFVNTNTPVADASIIAGNLALGSGSHRFVIGNSGALYADLTFLGTLRQESAAADIVKDGPGELELNVESTLTGAFTINDGLVIAEHSSAFGTSAGGTIVNGNGALKLTRGIGVREEPLTLNSVNPSAFGTIPLPNEPQYSNAWSGNITLQRTAGINVPDGVLNVSGRFDCCAGVISGPGGLTKGGSGTLLITGFFPNEYTGPTVVNDGVLEAWRILSPALPGDVVVSGPNSALRTGRSPANTALASGASVTVKNGAEWTMNTANSETIRALLGDGRVGIAVGFGNSAALTVDTTNSCEFAGSLIGFGSLDKRGPATLFLSGQSVSSYGGTSTVHQGTLRVDGSISGSPVTVKGGAQLRGDGAVGNVTAIEPDSVVRIDASFADHPDRQGGDLEVAHLTLAGGGVAAFDIFGPSPTGGNDLLIAHGPVSLDNARLSAGFNYPPREGDVVTLLRNNSPIPITGIFAGWPEGITRKLGDVTVRASYRGGDGNDFTLTVTNLALGLGGYRLVEGNGNQTVEPDECNLLFISLFNRRGTSLIVTNSSLRAVTQGAAVTISRASYPAISVSGSGENLTPFQFRTEPTLPCGQPVLFELTVGVAGEGVFAVSLEVPAGQGPDCERPTGGCESCHTVRGQFTANSPQLLRSPNFIGGPSLCFPPKRCPETNIFTDTVAVPYLTHTFTNSTTNELCLTAQVRFGCLGASTNALGAVAYLGTNDQHGPCVNYLGDSGADGTQPFSFRVPPMTNFLLLVSARATNVECPSYTLELFGLPCPPPKLHIARDVSVDKVLLEWSTAYPDYRLQATNALGHPGSHTFNNVTNAAVVVGGLYTVTNPVAPATQFYRLAR